MTARPSHSRILVAGLTIACAAAILYLGVPRAVAAYHALSGKKVLDRIADGEAVDTDDLLALGASHLDALQWIDDGRLRTQLGTTQFRLAVAGPTGPAPDPDMLAAAMGSLRQGLARAPANRAAWARLALAQHLQGGPSRAMADSLRMSILTGFYDRRLMFMRLDLCLRAWRHFSPDDRDLVFQQVRWAGFVSPRRLVGLADGPARRSIIRAALASTPRILQKFERALRRRRS